MKKIQDNEEYPSGIIPGVMITIMKGLHAQYGVSHVS